MLLSDATVLVARGRITHDHSCPSCKVENIEHAALWQDTRRSCAELDVDRFRLRSYVNVECQLLYRT